MYSNCTFVLLNNSTHTDTTTCTDSSIIKATPNWPIFTKLCSQGIPGQLHIVDRLKGHLEKWNNAATVSFSLFTRVFPVGTERTYMYIHMYTVHCVVQMPEWLCTALKQSCVEEVVLCGHNLLGRVFIDSYGGEPFKMATE